MSRLNTARLQTLPQRPREVWQGGLVRLPGWITEPDRKPYRAIAPLWVSLHTGMVHTGKLARPDEIDRREAARALVDFAFDEQLAGYRPGRLEVNSATLAEELAEGLAGAEIEVVHRESLLAVNRILGELIKSIGGRPDMPGPLDPTGITIDRVRSFAEAARVFYLASPWRHLEDVDLLRIETDIPDPSLRYATVLGAAGDTFGVGLFEAEDDLWTIYRSEEADPSLPPRGLWQVAFDPIQRIPLPDADLWLDHDLPVAGDDAYPYVTFVRPGGRVRRATPRVLAYLEGLLRALAESEEAEIDRGRWSNDVVTADGRMTLTLSLPYLLDPPDPQAMAARGVMPDRRALERTLWQIQRHLDAHPPADEQDLERTLQRFSGTAIEEMDFEPATSADKAQDLCYQAFDAQGRRQLQLAREALAIFPDSADAHVLLAERCADPLEALRRYERAVEAGERALGPEFFREERGHFWSMVGTRPYMRALDGLAGTFERLGRADGAIAHYQRMLELNPSDNQGARYRLLPLLFVADRDGDAAALVRDCDDEDSIIWAYAGALLAFRASGDTPGSREALRRAVGRNRLVAEYLLDERDAPAALRRKHTSPRDKEAMSCADLLWPAWDATDGAGAWLGRRVRSADREA